MNRAYTVEEFRAELASALEADGIQVQVNVHQDEPIGLSIDAWELATGAKQDVFTSGPVSLSATEARSLVERIRAHFGHDA